MRAVTRSSASTDTDTALQLAAYIDGLPGLPVDAVETACRRWPETDNGQFFPTLAELSKLAAKFDFQRRQANALPAPSPQHQPPRGPKRTLRDSPELRAEYIALMAELRAHPERFINAAALIAIGEDRMRRAGMIDASARAAA